MKSLFWNSVYSKSMILYYVSSVNCVLPSTRLQNIPTNLGDKYMKICALSQFFTFGTNPLVWMVSFAIILSHIMLRGSQTEFCATNYNSPQTGICTGLKSYGHRIKKGLTYIERMEILKYCKKCLCYYLVILKKFCLWL